MIAVLKNLVERNQLPACEIPMLILGTEPPPDLYDPNCYCDNAASVLLLTDVSSATILVDLYLIL